MRRARVCWSERQRWTVWAAWAVAALIAAVITSASSHSQAQSNVPVAEQSLSSVILILSDTEEIPLFANISSGLPVVDSEALSPEQLSDPSLSWILRQASERARQPALVFEWRAYISAEGIPYVDVVLFERAWNQLNYIRRYAFVSQVGSVAQRQGYQVRLFNTRDLDSRNDSLSDGSSASRSRRPTLLRGAYFCGTVTDEAQAACRVVVPAR